MDSTQYSVSPSKTTSFSSIGIINSSSPSFNSRRGNVKYSSAKFSTTTRPRKGSLLSFKSTRRNTARPARTKGVFESLLKGLTEGIAGLKEVAENMRSQLPLETDTVPTSRQHYYMELEKQVKGLERKIRTVEVHKDRIEELKDDYMLKLKLREGAFNLAQALSNNRPSKSTKEKLTETRIEQRDLSEDLCDIEDELETKLGVFKVHINEFTTLHRNVSNGEVIECQIKLAMQKWKARCKMGRHHQQFWQDSDIFLLGKVSDELVLKVVEVKRIQGNNHVGTLKCQMRDFFSIYPQSVHFVLPTNQSVKLHMDIKWSPLIGDDFISSLDLKTVHCIMDGDESVPGPIKSRGSSVKRRSGKDNEIKKTEKKSPSNESRNLSRSQSAGSKQDIKIRQHKSSPLLAKGRISTPDLLLLPKDNKIPSNQQHHYRSNSTGANLLHNVSSASKLDNNNMEDNLSVESGILDTGYRNEDKGIQNVSMSSLLESVLCGLEEPREQYHELKALESQLLRLENALKGYQLTKAPSVTLSESDVLDMFSFLENDDTAHRLSIHMPQISEEGHRTSSFSDFISLQPDHPIHETGSEGLGTGSSVHEEDEDIHDTKVVSETTGSKSIDRILLQHLLHCEHLLQHLQAQGPLKVKLATSLKKLHQESEVIKELLNMAAADSEKLTRIDKILPELAAHDHLMRFWKTVSAKDEPFCVSCEVFVTVLDEKYGHTLWSDYPQIANKVFSEMLSRVLGLEGDECDPMDSKMSVSVFQYASYFLFVGSSKAIPKSLKQIAQEMSITEGLRDGDVESKKRIASLLPKYPFNHGALFAAAYLMSDQDITFCDAAVAYLNNFTGNSPWRSKAILYYIEALEHSDQLIRIGACLALGQLQATEAAPQLQYLAKMDFSPVKAAAMQAIEDIGGECQLNSASSGKPSQPNPNPGLYRTRSMELLLESTKTRTKV